MSSENDIKAELEILLARNMELELLIQQQHSDIDEINEKNRNWFDAMHKVKRIVSMDNTGLEKHTLDEIKMTLENL